MGTAHLFGNGQWRHGSAIAIERRVQALARQSGLTVVGTRWNAQTSSHASGIYRLDVDVDDRVTKIYFTEHELATYDREPTWHAVDSRLQVVVDELQH